MLSNWLEVAAEYGLVCVEQEGADRRQGCQGGHTHCLCGPAQEDIVDQNLLGRV